MVVVGFIVRLDMARTVCKRTENSGMGETYSYMENNRMFRRREACERPVLLTLGRQRQEISVRRLAWFKQYQASQGHTVRPSLQNKNIKLIKL